MVKDFLCYPAIIEKTSKGDYKAYFPDIEGCSSKGKTIQDTITNCKEALGDYYLQNDSLKEASDPKDIELNKNQSLVYIDVNPKWILEKDKYKSITKAVTLPKWLNQKAIESGVNVSQVLQKALMETLDIKED